MDRDKQVAIGKRIVSAIRKQCEEIVCILECSDLTPEDVDELRGNAECIKDLATDIIDNIG